MRYLTGIFVAGLLCVGGQAFAQRAATDDGLVGTAPPEAVTVLTDSGEFTFAEPGDINEADTWCCVGPRQLPPCRDGRVVYFLKIGRIEMIRADLNHDWVVNERDVLVFEGLGELPEPGDWNGDGAIDVLDLLEFIDDWMEGHPGTDFDDDGDVTPFDLLAFLDLWFDQEDDPS